NPSLRAGRRYQPPDQLRQNVGTEFARRSAWDAASQVLGQGQCTDGRFPRGNISAALPNARTLLMVDRNDGLSLKRIPNSSETDHAAIALCGRAFVSAHFSHGASS